MGACLKIFDNYNDINETVSSSINYDEFDIDLIDKNFIISKTIDNKIISIYGDDIWDLSPYISNPSQLALINFNKRINKKNIESIKKLLLLLMFFGEGRNSSQYSVSSILHYFEEAFCSLSKYSIKYNLSIKIILSTNTYLLNFINSSVKNRIQVIVINSLVSFLHKQQNHITKISFSKDKKVFDKLKDLYNLYDNIQQTALIPSSILFESIQQRWQQIDLIEINIINIVNLLEEYFTNDQYSSIIKTTKKRYTTWDNEKEWNLFIYRHNLTNLFELHKVNNRLSFIRFIVNIQGTIKHLILAYTGMRIGEVLNLQTNCLIKKESGNGICRLISTTSKLAGRKQETTWVTTKKIEKTIAILRSLNQVIANYYQVDINKMPLFISSEILRNKYNFIDKLLVARPRFTYKNELTLDYDKCRITLEDKNEIENIEFNKNCIDINIGEVWRFRSHQYRRSLAVYSIQSGLVSLGALQIQLKHQFREMTLYYSNGASYAKKLFNIPKDHIAQDINKIKSDIDALVYIKDTIFSEDNLFGGHGLYVKRNMNTQKISLKLFLENNRDIITKLFKNGDIAYTSTSLGGCVSTEPCDALLSRSFIACGNCIKSVIKESKLNNLIEKQKEFIKLLDNNSIEYRTELSDLNELENQKKIFTGVNI